jgi:uncharacterized protein
VPLPARIERADGGTVCERCVVADRLLARARGLLGKRTLPRDEGLLLKPAGSIHTFFMRFPIDVVFLDRDLRVVGVRKALRPWRMAWAWRARATLELAAGECERRGVRVGDLLVRGN